MPPKVLKKFEKDLHRLSERGLMLIGEPGFHVMLRMDLSMTFFLACKFIFAFRPLLVHPQCPKGPHLLAKSDIP
jgi:hypothetical protein